MDNEPDQDELARFQREFRVGRAFSPNGPIDEEALFAGRKHQVQRLIRVIYQRGQHAIIYGERGVGKTSLVTVLRDLLAGTGTISVSRVNCDGTDNFARLWRKVLRDIVFLEQYEAAGFRRQSESVERSYEEMLPEKPTPDDIRRALTTISKSGPTVVVLDEFDRLSDKQTRTQIADTIKNLSDHSVDSTILVVGVADSVERLFGEHQSIQRASVQILMPRMSIPELKEIVTKALAKTDLTIDWQALEQIARLSQGLPHYTHLLGQHAAIAAAQADLSVIGVAHVELAISRAIDESHQSVRTAYQKATMSARTNMYKQVLLAAALAVPDELGYFSPSNVSEPLTKIMKSAHPVSTFNKHLEKLCLSERGQLLERKGHARRYWYRFSDPLMQPFVFLRGVQEKMIPLSVLAHPDEIVAHQSTISE